MYARLKTIHKTINSRVDDLDDPLTTPAHQRPEGVSEGDLKWFVQGATVCSISLKAMSIAGKVWQKILVIFKKVTS